MKSNNIDIFHINHLLLWIILGILFPNKYIYAFVLSILWEIFEILLVKIKFLYKLTKKYWVVDETYWNEIYMNKSFDIVLNMTGYVIGSNIEKYY
jgi:hypothetical protein